MSPPVADQSTIALPMETGVLRIRITLADRFLPRLIGLLGQATPPPPGTGLLLISRGGVHTVGMRYPIDILALDRTLTILRVHHAVAPGRFLRAPRGTGATLELAAHSVPPGLIGHRFHSEEDLA
ncbi:DUF192 domain-containing protein [Spiribacter vilamensis]|uniref:DUF192 domain-containing protein n=1 Tax=Spiribacter vilamensis TaxID=531306 RepID=A0A4Q8D006_9GAMM|nr:DUF192 domain-containing protein [Spiribacter vilamensis]RZU98636.1 hypothetical protein EV698_0891 [Spiribacter vilamensis]TVO60106.1 DUF192 domain-containing protein [Spiribacter vilamensis]